jgi:hypothetical protein
VIKVGAELGDKGSRGRYEGASAIPAMLHAYAYWSDDDVLSEQEAFYRGRELIVPGQP